MPEMSENSVMLLGRYQNLGTPEEIHSKRTSLEDDNRKQRDEIRDLKETTKKLPKEGERVLTADEAKEWEAYKALGQTPAELAKRAADFEVLAQKDAERTRSDNAAEAVVAEGWKPDAASVLLRLKDVDGATFEKKKVKEKDRAGADVEVERGFITLPGEGQKPQRLSEFVKAMPPAVATMLTGTAAGTGTAGTGASAERGGITYPPQRHGSGTPPPRPPPTSRCAPRTPRTRAPGSEQRGRPRRRATTS